MQIILIFTYNYLAIVQRVAGIIDKETNTNEQYLLTKLVRRKGLGVINKGYLLVNLPTVVAELP